LGVVPGPGALTTAGAAKLAMSCQQQSAI